jgi:hypothetical protein
MSRFLLMTGLALTVAAFFVESAQAQNTIVRFNFQYAVKFVCGGASGEDSIGVVTGVYATAVNVHNPGVGKAVFAKKVAVAFPFEIAGPISKFRLAQLQPNQAFEIDCVDIFSFFPEEEFKFLKGFVVIQSPVELDITAVYTARPSNGEVSTIDVETIAPRKLRGTVAVEPAPQAVVHVASSREQLRISVKGLDWLVRSTALSVFDLQGRTIYASGSTAGDLLSWNFATIDGRALAKGVYWAVITAMGKHGEMITSMRKIVVSR